MYSKEIKDLNEMLKTMVETQRLNKDSVNKLSRDTHEILTKLAEVELLKIELNSVKARITNLQKQQMWFTKLLLTLIISGILGFSIFKLNNKKEIPPKNICNINEKQTDTNRVTLDGISQNKNQNEVFENEK